MPMKTAVEVEEDLKKEYEKKLRDIDLFLTRLKPHMAG